MAYGNHNVAEISETQKVSFDASTQSSAVGSDTKAVTLYATEDCWVRRGSDPTATATPGSGDIYIPGSTLMTLPITGGFKIAAIKDTVAGKTHVDPAVAGKLFDHVAQKTPHPESAIIAELSERERDVLRLLARGLSNADIAARLYLSEGTVRNYVSSIFTKLEVTDRTQAAVLAIRYGVVDIQDL